MAGTLFHFDDETLLLTEENECKPNRHMAMALMLGFLAQLICLLLNELNLFYVDKGIMRGGTLVAFICMLIPQILVRQKELVSNPKCKYFIFGCVFCTTFFQMLVLFIFTTPLCILPVLLAVQYNSRKMAGLGILGTCICSAVTPPLGCALGLWDTSFLQYLLSNALGAETELVFLTPISRVTTMGGVIAFVSFPWTLILLAFSGLILSAAKKGEENISNRIKILQISRMDILTGLYNQNVYRQFLTADMGEQPVGILFFDVDGLKKINDEKGHEYGDLLLQRCGESLKRILDANCRGFRIGGDEFVVAADTASPAYLERKVSEWRAALKEINRQNETEQNGIFCHMSVGTAFGSTTELQELIARADKCMYEEKEKYHRLLSAGRQ